MFFYPSSSDNISGEPDMTWTWVARDGYLVFTVGGVFTEQGGQAIVAEIKREAEAHHVTRVLIDALALKPPHSEMVRFHTGVAMAKVWQGSIKVASVARPEYINYFTETTAVNRGAWFRAFLNAEQALCWLLEDTDKH